eukprot:scaffold64_cov338-Pavlova_lutheri.AAC.61
MWRAPAAEDEAPMASKEEFLLRGADGGFRVWRSGSSPTGVVVLWRWNGMRARARGRTGRHLHRWRASVVAVEGSAAPRLAWMARAGPSPIYDGPTTTTTTTTMCRDISSRVCLSENVLDWMC